MAVDKSILRSIFPRPEQAVFDCIEEKYLSDTLGRKKGRAEALVFPESTEQVSRLLA